MDAQYQAGAKQINETGAETRKQALENLSARGVRTSGISENAIGKITKATQSDLNNLSSSLTIAEILAARDRAQTKANQQYSYLAGNASGQIQTPSYLPSASGSNYLAALYNQNAANQNQINTIGSNIGSLLGYYSYMNQNPVTQQSATSYQYNPLASAYGYIPVANPGKVDKSGNLYV